MDDLDLDKYEVSQTAVEAALKAFDVEEDVDFLHKLQTRGYDYRKPRRSYPYSQYIKILRTFLEEFYPAMPEAEAALMLGRRMYKGLTKTIAGRVASAAFRFVSLNRVLVLSVQALNHNSSFGERELIRIADTHYIIKFSDDIGAQNVILLNQATGSFQALFESLKVPNAIVKWRVISSLSFEIEIKW